MVARDAQSCRIWCPQLTGKNFAPDKREDKVSKPCLAPVSRFFCLSEEVNDPFAMAFGWVILVLLPFSMIGDAKSQK